MEELIKLVCHIFMTNREEFLKGRNTHEARSVFCYVGYYNGFSQREISALFDQSVPNISFQVKKALKSKNESFIANRNKVESMYKEYRTKLQTASTEIVQELINQNS